MRLDVSFLKYLDKDAFRVLTSVEMGMRNHELVPLQIVASVAGIRGAGAFRALGELHKNKLVWHSAAPYDGYKLTALGYDFLALHKFQRQGAIAAVGRRIGCGKESDIYVCTDPSGRKLALKLHRLGRTSFRAVKAKRDYLGKNKQTSNWLYLSRLAATKEYAFMRVLHGHGFPVPEPVAQNRHGVLMELCDGDLLAHVSTLANPGDVYAEAVELVVRLAQHGLIHCDFNEFNLIAHTDPETLATHLKLIDFPQMVSTSHANAEFYFDRDVQCLRTFFARRFGFEAAECPVFARDVVRVGESLDVEVAASGYNPSAADDAMLLASTSAHAPSDDSTAVEAEREGDDEEDEDDEGEASTTSASTQEEQSIPEITECHEEAAAASSAVVGDDDDGDDVDEKEESEEEEMREEGVVDKKQVARSARDKVAVKHKAPVRKLAHPHKSAAVRALHSTIREELA